MLSEKVMTVGAGRPTAGPVSLAQGVYGTRGNLELLACDALDGLWVFWFNADHPDDPLTTPDVPSGHWSAGLAFAAGSRYLDAQIVQSSLGPDHLEVLALTADGVLQSWYWSPGPGFQRRATAVAEGVRAFRLAHADGHLDAALSLLDGTAARAASSPDDYPDRAWSITPGPGPADDGADAVLAARGIRDVSPGTARLAHSTRGGGAIELTWRDAHGIRHLALPA